MAKKNEKRRNTCKPKRTPENNPRMCPDCGFLMRGKNHNEGVHHQQGKGGKYAPPKKH